MSLTSSSPVGPPLPAHLALLSLVTGGGWDQAVAGVEQDPARSPVVYGPGRGLWLDRETALAEMAAGRIAKVELGDAPGCWVISRGPGALGLSASQRDGVERPSLHCTSWTNLLLGVALGVDAAWRHSGNIPPLEWICTERGEGVWTNPHNASDKACAYGYGDHVRSVTPRRGRTMRLREVWERRAELGTITVAAQSTYRGPGPNDYRWEHHTVAFLRVPGRADLLYRVAADGSASAGLYSGTPMDVEVVDGALAAARGATYLYRAWTLPRLNPSRCPITLEI